VPEQAALSRTRLARLLAEGAVSVGGAVVTDARTRPEEGATVEIALAPPMPSHIAPEAIPLDILHEDEALIVVHKPAGMVVHPAPGTPYGTLVNALIAHCGDTLSGIGGEVRPGIVHRIDKDTSGLLVVAKTDAAHHGLAAQFEAHSAERSYVAICHGVPDRADPRLAGQRGISFEEGGVVKISTRLDRHRADRQKQAVTFSSGRHAVTRARVTEPLCGGALALLECRLETGRTHQIRVHMAYAGHALVGDPVYGGKRRVPPRLGAAAEAAGAFPRQALHAASLGFEHPLHGGWMQFDAPLPEDMARLLEVLRGAGGNAAPRED